MTKASGVLPAGPRARPRGVAAPARTCTDTEGCRRGVAGGRPRSRAPSRYADRREGAEDMPGTVGSNDSTAVFAPPLRPPSRRARHGPPKRRIDRVRGLSSHSLGFHPGSCPPGRRQMSRAIACGRGACHRQDGAGHHSGSTGRPAQVHRPKIPGEAGHAGSRRPVGGPPPSMVAYCAATPSGTSRPHHLQASRLGSPSVSAGGAPAHRIHRLRPARRGDPRGDRCGARQASFPPRTDLP